MNDYDDGFCCTPNRGECCGPGSWCCKRAGKHNHDDEDPWLGETNPLGCCVHNKTEGGVPTHGGPGCIWPHGKVEQ